MVTSSLSGVTLTGVMLDRTVKGSRELSTMAWDDRCGGRTGGYRDLGIVAESFHPPPLWRCKIDINTSFLPISLPIDLESPST